MQKHANEQSYSIVMNMKYQHFNERDGGGGVH